MGYKAGGLLIFPVFVMILFIALQFSNAPSNLTGQANFALGAFKFNIPTGSQAQSFYVYVLLLAIPIAIATGVSILGSGLQSESVHILFVGGVLLVIWLILSAIEGFIAGSPSSIFTQLNAPGGLNFGTFTFAILTLMYCLGTVGAVSRGGI